MLILTLALIGACECKKHAATTPVPPTPVVVVDAGPPPVMTAPDAAPPPPDPAAQRATCCAQCNAAASQDPSGMDISVSPCTKYLGVQVNGKAALDDACSAYFSANSDLSIGECRGAAAP
jgi:hypothetical protein